uniref:Mitochondrial import receptor subunit TOM70 n=1 Tax=Acrobeloides nanus TaxID=290746 RepID=A0A914CQ76_9BILA
MSDSIENNSFLRSYGRYIGIAGVGIGVLGVGYYIYRSQRGQSISKPKEFSQGLGSIKPLLHSAIKKKDEGNTYFKKKNYAEALRAFEEGIQLCPEDAHELRSNLYQNIAVILEYNKDYHGCAENCTKAILLNSRYLKAIKRRAHAYAKMNCHKEALVDMQIAQILQNAPATEPTEDIENSVQLLANKKKDEYFRQHKEEPIPISQEVVLEWLTSSLIHDPFLKKINELITATNSYERALLALKQGRYNEVLELALEELSIEDSPNRLESALLAARFYFLHNQVEKGNETLQEFKNLYDSFDEESQKNYTNFFDEESQKNYTNLYVAYQILRMIYAEEIISTRKTIADACLMIEPNNSDPLFVLGLCCFNDEDLNDSVDAFMRVKEIEPDHPYIMFYLLYSKFIAALKRNDMSQAHHCVVQFDETLKQKAAPAYAHFMACRIYSQMQNIELAMEELDKSLQIKPDYVDAIYLKSLLNVDPMVVQTEEGLKLFMAQVEKTMNDLISIEPNFAEPYKMLAKIFVDKKDFSKAFECYEKAMKLTRKPSEMLLLMAEYLMAEARVDAINYLEQHPA